MFARWSNSAEGTLTGVTVYHSLAGAAAYFNEPGVIRWLREDRKSDEGYDLDELDMSPRSAPIMRAFSTYHKEAFLALLDCGVSLRGSYAFDYDGPVLEPETRMPILFLLLHGATTLDDTKATNPDMPLKTRKASEEELLDVRLECLRAAIARDPTALKELSFLNAGGNQLVHATAMDVCLHTKRPELLLRMVLDAGVSIRIDLSLETRPGDGREVAHVPTIIQAIGTTTLAGLKFLVEDLGILKDAERRYSEEALEAIALSFALLLYACCYDNAPTPCATRMKRKLSSWLSVEVGLEFTTLGAGAA
jgi:hypothetical protein